MRSISFGFILSLFLMLVYAGYLAFDQDPYAFDQSVDHLTLRLDHLSSEGQRLTQETVRDRWVLLTVWASWCPSCREHWSDSIKAADVTLIGVAFRDPNAAAWLHKHPSPINTQVITNTDDIIQSLGVISAPESFLIDPQQHVVKKWYGPLSQEALNKALHEYRGDHG